MWCYTGTCVAWCAYDAGCIPLTTPSQPFLPSPPLPPALPSPPSPPVPPSPPSPPSPPHLVYHGPWCGDHTLAPRAPVSLL